MTQFQFGQAQPGQPGAKPPWYLTLWAGFLLGAALIALWVVAFFTINNLMSGGSLQNTVVSVLGLGAPIAYIVGAIVLLALPRTARLGGGMLLASGASILVVAGACVILFATMA